MHDLMVAVALVLVIEGLLPFIFPRGMKRAWLEMARLEDRMLRIAGLVSMFVGVVLLQFLK